jgi:hypothetical protein
LPNIEIPAGRASYRKIGARPPPRETNGAPAKRTAPQHGGIMIDMHGAARLAGRRAADVSGH